MASPAPLFTRSGLYAVSALMGVAAVMVGTLALAMAFLAQPQANSRIPQSTPEDMTSHRAFAVVWLLLAGLNLKGVIDRQPWGMANRRIPSGLGIMAFAFAVLLAWFCWSAGEAVMRVLDEADVAWTTATAFPHLCRRASMLVLPMSMLSHFALVAWWRDSGRSLQVHSGIAEV